MVSGVCRDPGRSSVGSQSDGGEVIKLVRGSLVRT